MRKTVFTLIGMYVLSSCFSSERPEFLNYNWKNQERVWIKNGMHNSYTHFDSKTGKMVGDSLTPIEVIDDSLLVITSVKGIGKSDENNNIIPNRDSVFIDTFYYEIRNFKGSKLILYNINRTSRFILHMDGDDTKLPNYNNFRYEIAGFSVGDSIDRNLLDFQESRGEKLIIEQASLKANPNVKLDIVGNYFIYHLRQHNLTDEDFKIFYEDISNAIKNEPEHTPLREEEDFISEHYQWRKNLAILSISRLEYKKNHILYKRNRKYTDWTLSFSDFITTRLLLSEFSNGPSKYLPHQQNSSPSVTHGRTPSERLKRTLPGILDPTPIERLKTTPPGLFSYNVNRNVVTDMYIKKGEKIALSGKGSLKIGPYVSSVGPNGMSGYEVYSLIKEFPHGCLMASIGDNGQWFEVGERTTITADQSGYLMLYINDNNPKNNSGSFNVTCLKL